MIEPTPGVYGWIHQRAPMTATVGWVQATNGVAFHRVAEPLRAARDLGYVDTSVGSILDDATLERHDTIVASMLHDQRGTDAWQKIAAAGSHRLVLDVDDAMWAPDYYAFKCHYTPEVLDRLIANVTAAHVVTTPAPAIAEYLHRYNRNVWIVPNTVPGFVMDLPRYVGSGPRIGYQGSPSHVRDWPVSQRRAVARFMRERDWSILFAGLGDVPDGWPADRTYATQWLPAGSREYYSGLQFHVGIGPLKDTTFNRCKSSLRAVEYAALGIVAVLPDLPIYQGWVDDGVTGRLVRSHQTLRSVLHEIADDPQWIDHMSANARDRAKQWTTEAQIERWIAAWVSR